MQRKAYCLGACSSCAGLSALVLLVIAILLGVEYSTINDEIKHMIDESVTLKPGHATYEQLKDPTLPLWKDFNFFNLTNPEEFAAGEMPNLTAIGPYSYREQRKKFFHGFSVDNTELTYNQSRLYYWDNGTSGEGLQETDTICTINIPLLTAIMEVEEYAKEHGSIIGGVAKEMLRGIISETGAKLYVCVPAHDLAWNYTDRFVEKLHTDEILKLTGLAYPRCCVSLQYNGTTNDSLPSIIYTGVKHIDRIGQFRQWDGLTKLKIWPGATANDINGTEGLFFKPNIRKGEPLMAFISDVIRSFDIVQVGKRKHLGLEAWHYVMNNNTFLSPLHYPPNSRWGTWEYDGLIYLGVTQYPTVPIYGSKPHFLDGDPALRAKVIGMHPDRAKHDTDIDVEIYTGANIQFRQQLQINAKAEQNSDFAETANLNGTLYYPVLYINEHAELTESFKHYLESKGLKMVLVFHQIYWPMFGVFLFLAVATMLITMVMCFYFVRVVRGTGNHYTPIQ